MVVVPKIALLSGDGGAVPGYLGRPGPAAKILTKLTPGLGHIAAITAMIPVG